MEYLRFVYGPVEPVKQSERYVPLDETICQLDEMQLEDFCGDQTKWLILLGWYDARRKRLNTVTKLKNSVTRYDKKTSSGTKITSKGLKDAHASWEYPLNVERMNGCNFSLDRHGITKWIFRKKQVNGMHREEIEEQRKARAVRGHLNTGGKRPEGATFDWTKEVMRHDPTNFIDEGNSPTAAVWDGDAFVIEDRPDYEGGFITFSGPKLPDHMKVKEAVDKAKAEMAAGKLCSLLDPPDQIVVNEDGTKYNRANPRFRWWMWEINRVTKNYNKNEKALAGEIGIVYNTARQKEMEQTNMSKEMPNTKFTKKQIDEMLAADGRVAFVHVVLSGRGFWHKLDMNQFETYGAAIADVKQRSLNEALKQNDARTLKEIVVKFNEAFAPENIYIIDWRSPTVAAIAEVEWEKEKEA